MKQIFLKSFCARYLTLLVFALLSTNLTWGETISPTAATTLKDGGKYVIGTASTNGSFLTSSVSGDWGTATTLLKDAAIFTITGDENGFYAECSNGYLIPATSKTFNAYNSTKPSSANLQLASNGALINKSNTSWALRLNTNFRWYSSQTGSAVYLFEVQGSSKTLESIAISGTPDKTTYETGESFDPAGLTVTGTYDDTSTADLTEDAEWTIDPATFTSTSQTSVSVTATVDGKTDTKSYDVTVNEHIVTPGTFEIALDKDLYGIAKAGNVEKEQSITKYDITIVSGCTSRASSKTYYDTNHIRYYTDSYLKLSVPEGYLITKIVFTAFDKNWDDTGVEVVPGSYTSKIWTGKSQEVDFSFSKQCRAASITVTYELKKTLSTIAVKTPPTKTTYYVGDEFDPAGLVITATYDDESTEDIAYTEVNKDAFSFSGFNSEAVATGQEITVTYAEKSATFTVDIKAARTLKSIYVSKYPDKMDYEVGEALDLTGLVIKGEFSEGEDEEVEYTADPKDGTILNQIGTTVVTFTSVDNPELTNFIIVGVNAIEGDRLTLASTGVSGASYTEWTNKTGSEGVAVYAGKSAGGNSSIQLNTTSSNGLVSTTSAGFIRKVKVDWNSNTSSTGNRSIDIYGSITAYTSSGDIYNTEKQGTKLGSIVCGTSTELEVEGDYEYVGIKAVGGALYMNSITFVWDRTQDVEITDAKYATLGLPYAVTIPEGVSAYTATVDGTTVTMTKIKNGVIPANCGVILYAETPDTYTLTETVDVDPIEDNKLVAVIGETYTCTGEDVDKVYYLGKDDGKATFKKLNVNGTIAKGKAYLKLDEVLSEGAKLEVTFDGEATGIKSLTPALSEGKGAYNLQGVRVNNGYKGIVIMNGKKYINK